MAAISSVDITVIGGGPVGMVCALLLCKQGFSVVLIDKASCKDIVTANYDGRSFAYAYGSKLILEKYGIWDELSLYAEPILDICVSATSQTKGLHYSSAELTHPLGYNIETRYFRKIVYQQLMQEENFTLLDESSIVSIDNNDYGVQIMVNNNQQIRASLLLAADGKESFVRGVCAIPAKNFSYRQKAITYVISHEKSHNNCAYEYFLKTGPMAVLPMQNKHSAIIWSLNNTQADIIGRLSNDELIAETSRHFGSVLGSMHIASEIGVFPLSMTAVRNYVSRRMILIGDSAHSIHPVAGQGFNLGLRDINTLIDMLSEQQKLGCDIGSGAMLKQYEKARRLDVISMTGMCDLLIRLFSNDYSVMRKVGQKGLELINSAKPIKNFLNHKAMGL